MYLLIATASDEGDRYCYATFRVVAVAARSLAEEPVSARVAAKPLNRFLLPPLSGSSFKFRVYLWDRSSLQARANKSSAPVRLTRDATWQVNTPPRKVPRRSYLTIRK